jgi:putative MATE family efflux protein
MNEIHSLLERHTMETKIDFITGNTKKSLFAITVPMLLAMFLNMAYNLVDSLWIGNLLGKTAYAAFTGSLPVILILLSVAMGATNGMAILISQAIGSADHNRGDTLIASSLLGTLIFAVMVTIGCEGLLPAIARLSGVPSETYGLVLDYLSIYLLGYPVMSLYLYFAAVLRSFGNSLFQAMSMLMATVLNAILDPLCIRNLGFKGAALATLVSQSICLVTIILYLHKKKLFRIDLSKVSRNVLLPLMQKAVPSIIQQCIPAVSTMFLTSLVGSYGITALVGYGIAGRIEIILLYPAMALNMVLTIIVGQCVGGLRYDRVKEYLKAATWNSSLIVLMLSFLVVVSSGYLSGLFVKAGDAAIIVKGYFLIIGAGYVCNMVTNCLLGLLNGMGYPSLSMLLMVLYYLLIRIPLAYLFSYFGFGLHGIWLAVLISHVIACLAAMAMAHHHVDRKCFMNVPVREGNGMTLS